MFSTSFIALTVASVVVAQGTPLVDKRFPFTALPYRADNDDGPRGTQQGYNLCNSTTEGPKSLCQTATVNHIDDFCLWSAPGPNQIIADTEGETVAWCTKPGRGTRIIPEGALTGVQFLRAPAYVQVTGRIKQDFIGLTKDDFGGELDPHGADSRGNPLGGLVYSNAFPSNNGNNNSFQQVIEWHNFVGGGTFCFKACDPTGANDADYCQHIFDRIGCTYNAPADYTDGVFLACDSDNQDFPGVYTGENGAVSTYSQPPESLGPITTVPYTAKIPKTSNCVTYTSSVIYASLNSAAPTSSAASSGSGSMTTGASGSSTVSRTGSGSGSAAATSTGGATVMKPAVGIMAALLGAVIAL